MMVLWLHTVRHRQHVTGRIQADFHSDSSLSAEVDLDSLRAEVLPRQLSPHSEGSAHEMSTSQPQQREEQQRDSMLDQHHSGVIY